MSLAAMALVLVAGMPHRALRVDVTELVLTDAVETEGDYRHAEAIDTVAAAPPAGPTLPSGTSWMACQTDPARAIWRAVLTSRVTAPRAPPGAFA